LRRGAFVSLLTVNSRVLPMIVLALCLAYGLGCLSPGWWLVRRATGGDLRDQGSGGTGATNAARVLGGWAFATVLLLDAAKAAGAVLLARALASDTPWHVLALPAAVAGHIWPAPLRFRGGKGAGPLLGGAVALNPWFLAAAVAGAGLGAAVNRRVRVATTSAAVAGVAASPWLLPGRPERVAFAVAVALVVLAHRRYFMRPSDRSHSLPSPGAHGNCDVIQNRDDGR
jgi:glycerol-3-phosphate acyltransferase PlsY